MKNLKISKHRSLPLDAITQTFAFIARRGAGKTYGATKLAEEMFEANAQIVAIDPVGVWWGLRLNADGKTPGLDIPVFGGLHGDIPLEPQAGALVADVVIENGMSVILDVSMMRKHHRKQFATDFAEQLFHRKKSARSPVHLFIEEAQVFVPQKVFKGEERLLGAFEDIIKLGRNYGIGATLISQRPQSVNKDVLNQTEGLFVLQINGRQERKAIEEWVVYQGLDIEEMVAQLPSLPRGQAFLWSPQWLGILEKISIAKKKTYDASATPEIGKRTVQRKLAPVDLERIKSAMQTSIAQAESNDPKVLQRRIVDLEKQLRAQPKQVVSAPAQTKIERVEVPVVREKELAALSKAVERFEKAQEQIGNLLSGKYEAMSAAGTLLKTALHSARQLAQPVATVPVAHRVAPVKTERAVQARNFSIPFSQDSGDLVLDKAKRAILIALAQYQNGLNKRQIAVLAGYAMKGGAFNNALSYLKVREAIAATGGHFTITSIGLNALGDGWSPLPRGKELYQYWINQLNQAEREILRVLHESYPNEMSKQEIAELTVSSASGPYDATGGAFNNALSKLRTLMLIEGRQRMKVCDEFFIGESQ